MMNTDTEMPFFFRSELKDLSLYAVADGATFTRLHQNEGIPHDAGMAEICAKLVREAYAGDRPLNIYPNLVPTGLIEAFAAYLKTSPECLEVTAGSSEGLTLISQACFEKGRKIAAPYPGFSLYHALTKLMGATPVNVSLDENMRYTRQCLFNESVLGSSVTFLCSPNNPTGSVVPLPLLEEFLQKYRGLVVFDEAYFEFFEAEGAQSAVSLVPKYANLLVLRTLSKAWGAASLRVGCMIAQPQVIAVFRTLRPPYSIPHVSEKVGEYLLRDYQQEMRLRVKRTVENRRMLEAELKKIPDLTLYPSHANFVCFKHPRAQQLSRYLKEEHNFLLRVYKGGKFDNMMRMTLWTETENQRFLQVTKDFLT